MANILHIETSTEQCGVALAQNTTILGSREVLENGFTHAKQLHTLIAVSYTHLRAHETN